MIPGTSGAVAMRLARRVAHHTVCVALNAILFLSRRNHAVFSVLPRTFLSCRNVPASWKRRKRCTQFSRSQSSNRYRRLEARMEDPGGILSAEKKMERKRKKERKDRTERSKERNEK